ncbi:hypothetical protein [Vibrio parahaemolyticus]|uniref:hypothetical protein n=1 Tax=Vibrio parahaemolyticus TaxID=670 RepID=UPI002B36C921|nr:hypothetical protein [Vibrio harveyi]
MKLVTFIKNALTFKPYTDKTTISDWNNHKRFQPTSCLGMTIDELRESYNEKVKSVQKCSSKRNEIRNRRGEHPLFFSLTFYEYAQTLKYSRCVYTNRRLSKNYFSIDRIDPRLSYTRANSVLCDVDFNQEKGETFDQLLRIAIDDDVLFNSLSLPSKKHFFAPRNPNRQSSNNFMLRELLTSCLCVLKEREEKYGL